MKKVFISVSSMEKDLGTLFKNALVRLFNEKMEGCFLFNIPPGAYWKKTIKENLQRSDILVSILSPHYLKRPWAYVEWTAFWLDDNKHIFILVPDKDVLTNSYYNAIFNYTQSASFEESDALVNMIYEIGKALGYSEQELSLRVDQTIVHDLIRDLKQNYAEILKKIKSVEFDRYKDNAVELPFSDAEKKDIALHFFEKKDDETFVRIFGKILSEEIKFEIAKIVLAKENVKLFQEVISTIFSSDRLVSILVYIVYQKQIVNHEFRNIVINQMDTTGDVPLMEFLLYMIRNGYENNDLFLKVVSLLDDDLARRIVYLNLYEKERYNEAKYVFSKLTGNPEKRVIALKFAEKDNFEMFSKVVKKITNCSELFRLIKGLELKDKNIDKKYIEEIVSHINESPTLACVLNYFVEEELCESYSSISEIINSKLEKIRLIEKGE